jgi:hypothetical protein
MADGCIGRMAAGWLTGWLTMHSDGSFGCTASGQKPEPMLVQMQTGCPFCGPDQVHPEDDPGETMEHWYATCPGLDDLWTWAAATFPLPAGGQHAAPNATAAVQDPDKTRRALVDRVLPHLLLGLLSVIKLDDKQNILGASSPLGRHRTP